MIFEMPLFVNHDLHLANRNSAPKQGHDDSQSDPANVSETSLSEGIAGSVRSASIPLPSSHVHRTQSELQLSIDEAAAERRDIHMFYRLVNGIRRRQGLGPRDETDSTIEKSIVGIVQTRCAPLISPSTDHGVSVTQEIDHNDHSRLSTIPPTIHHPNDASPSDNWSISGFGEPEDTLGIRGNFNHHGDEYGDEDEMFPLDL